MKARDDYIRYLVRERLVHPRRAAERAGSLDHPGWVEARRLQAEVKRLTAALEQAEQRAAEAIERVRVPSEGKCVGPGLDMTVNA